MEYDVQLCGIQSRHFKSPVVFCFAANSLHDFPVEDIWKPDQYKLTFSFLFINIAFNFERWGENMNLSGCVMHI